VPHAWMLEDNPLFLTHDMATVRQFEITPFIIQQRVVIARILCTNIEIG